MRLIRRWEGLQRSGTRAHVRGQVCEQLSQSRRLELPRVGDKGMITHLRGSYEPRSSLKTVGRATLNGRLHGHGHTSTSYSKT